MNWLKQLATYDFWFYVNPVTLSIVDKAFGLVAGLLIVFAIVTSIAAWISKNKIIKALLFRLRTFFVSMGLLTALWFLVRFQNVRVLGTHFAFFLVAVCGLIWFGYILSYLVRRYRIEKRAWEKEQLKLKYLA